MHNACESCSSNSRFFESRYLSLDSYALIDAAPRRSAESVLDICCGSGVQGLVALRHYAAKAGHWHYFGEGYWRYLEMYRKLRSTEKTLSYFILFLCFSLA